MKWVDTIFSLVWDASDFFYNAYLEVMGWIIPFSYLKTPLYALYKVCWDLTTPIAQFGDWADDVADKVSDILSLSDIRRALKTWLDYASDAWGWVSNAITNITNAVGIWWQATKVTVQGWIAIALQTAKDLVAAVSLSLATLKAAWDEFELKLPSIDEVLLWFTDWWSKILSPLTTWWNEKLKEVDNLIDSTLKRWFPFYDDLVRLWEGIKLFFTDPEEWLYKAADRIIERFW